MDTDVTRHKYSLDPHVSRVQSEGVSLELSGQGVEQEAYLYRRQLRHKRDLRANTGEI